jgi:hypothetical protein
MYGGFTKDRHKQSITLSEKQVINNVADGMDLPACAAITISQRL